MASSIAKSVKEISPRCTIKAGWGTQKTVPECYDLCVSLLKSVRDAGDEGAVATLMAASQNGWDEVKDLNRSIKSRL